MEIREIQQGTRVTYAIGDVEYDAVALGAVTTGYNHAIRSGGFFLSLRYLNEQGEPVTVNGAPLLGIEDTDLSAPRTTGWHARRADDDKRPEPLPVQPAPVHEFAQEARTPPPAVLGIGPEIVPPPVVEAEQDLAEAKAKAEAEIAAADAGHPSSEDLDTVAAEQSVAEQTSAEPTADDAAPQHDAAEPTA